MDKADNTSPRSARFWRDQAEDTWSMASRMLDPKAKATLVEIAERYDMLADRAQKRETSTPFPGRDNILENAATP